MARSKFGTANVPHRKNTAAMPAVRMPVPATVTLPLSMHIGAPAALCVAVGDKGKVGQPIAEAAGFGVVRDWIGHGVGRDVHEDPEVPNFGKPGKGFVLKPGMTIAIEPMITLTKKGEKTDVLENDWTVVTRDRCLSAHFEHTVAITTSGCEVLTLPADYP